MESAVLGVILDSSVVIEAEWQQLNVAQFLKHIVQKIGEREVALCAITVAELVHGIYRASCCCPCSSNEPPRLLMAELGLG